MRNIICTLSLVLLTSGAAAAQDRIFLKGSDQPLEGTVTSMSYKEVKYEDTSTGIEQPLDASTVQKIEFGRDPRNYDFVTAEDAFRRGDFQEARDKFERVRRDNRMSQALRQFARFYIVRCSLELGEPQPAIDAAKALRQEFPDSYFLRDSFQLQYDAARMIGGQGTAPLQQVVDEFKEFVSKKGVREWEKSVDLLEADVSEVKGDFKTARQKHEKYMNDKDGDVALAAKMGQLRAMAGMQDWSGLRSRADALIADSKTKPAPPALLFAAYLAKGKALLFGEKKNRDALLELMRCVDLLSPRFAEPIREREEAIAYAAIATARFGAEQPSPEKKQVYRGRAEALRGDLLRQYPNSWYKAMVDKEISALPR